jgi:hypothetical protein
MTDNELKKFIAEHQHWPEAGLLAFVAANMDFDEAAERRRIAREILDRAIARGELVQDGHGRIIEAELAPPDFVDPHPTRPQ